jgi:hypothetical protein
MHPSDLTSKDVNGLDIVELRAVFASLPETFGVVDIGGAKKDWRDRVQTRLQRLCEKEANGTLTSHEKRHASYKEGYGPFDPTAVVHPSLITTSSFHEKKKNSSITADEIQVGCGNKIKELLLEHQAAELKKSTISSLKKTNIVIEKGLGGGVTEEYKQLLGKLLGKDPNETV